jgi:hypothetical protein
MSVQHDSPAVAVARAHVDAWANHDYDTARQGLAEDVWVTATTIDPAPPKHPGGSIWGTGPRRTAARIPTAAIFTQSLPPLKTLGVLHRRRPRPDLGDTSGWSEG